MDPDIISLSVSDDSDLEDYRSGTDLDAVTTQHVTDLDPVSYFDTVPIIGHLRDEPSLLPGSAVGGLGSSAGPVMGLPETGCPLMPGSALGNPGSVLGPFRSEEIIIQRIVRPRTTFWSSKGPAMAHKCFKYNILTGISGVTFTPRLHKQAWWLSCLHPEILSGFTKTFYAPPGRPTYARAAECAGVGLYRFKRDMTKTIGVITGVDTGLSVVVSSKSDIAWLKAISSQMYVDE